MYIYVFTYVNVTLSWDGIFPVNWGPIDFRKLITLTIKTMDAITFP